MIDRPVTDPGLQITDPAPEDPMIGGTWQDWEALAPWHVFRSDVVIEVSHVLTEPTCPTARIVFELPERAGRHIISTGIGNTVAEAIAGAVEEARKVLPQITEARRSELAQMQADREAQQ